MKRYFFLIPLLFAILIIFVPINVFALIGGTIVNNNNIKSFDGKTGIVIINVSPEITDNSGRISDFFFYNNTSSYTIPTGFGTYVFNVNSCILKLYPPVLDTTGVPPLVSAYTFAIKQSPTINGAFITSSLVNSTCTSIITNKQDFLQINTTKSNANATFNVSYTLVGGNPIKATYKVVPKVNGSFWMITESQNNIPFKIRTVNATFLENSNIPSNTTSTQITSSIKNGGKVFLFDVVGNLVTYDYQSAINSLFKTEIIYNPSSGKANLSNDFKSSTQIPINSTFSVDPTFGFTTGNNWQVITTQTTGIACGTPTTKQNLFNDITIPDTTTNQACSRMAYQFPIGVLNNTIVDRVQLKFDVTSVTDANTCNINNVKDQPSTATASTLWNDIETGNNFATANTSCQSLVNGTVIDLGNNAVSSIQSRINNAVTNNWFALGIKASSELRDVSLHSNTFGSNSIQLFVSYHIATPSAPINIAAIGHPHKNTITYNMPISKGSAPITNYNLYRTTFPFASIELPDGGGIDTANYNSKINMNGNTILQHFDQISKGYYNDSSGNKQDIKLTNFVILPNDLKAYWRMDETAGKIYNKANYLNETTGLGTGADGIPGGVFSYSQTGIVKKAIFSSGGQFTFGTSKSQFNFMHNGTMQWTFVTWYKRGHLPVGITTSIFGTSGGNPNNAGIEINIINGTGTGQLRIFISSGIGGGTASCTTGNNFFPNEGNNWHMLVINGSKARVGNEFMANIDNGPVFRCGISFVYGNGDAGDAAQLWSDGSSTSRFTGSFDETSIWNRLLSPSEITKLYNSGIGKTLSNYPGLTSKAKFGKAANFDGDYSFLNFTSTIMPKSTNTFTLMGWDKFNDTTNPLNMLAFKTSIDRSHIQVNGSFASIYSNNQFLLQCGETRHIGSWNFDAFTYDGVTAKYYSNGTLVCSNPSGLGLGTPTNNNYTIGISPKDNAKYYNGTLDELAILNRVMSSTEITNVWMRGNTSLLFEKQVGNVTTIDHTGLGNGTSWYYRVQAKNAIGNGTLSEVVNSTTSVIPNPPASITYALISPIRIDIFCSPPISDGHDPIQSYQLLRNGTILVNSTTSLCTKYSDTPINAGDAQTYSICAWNGVGCSSYKTITTLPNPPTIGTLYINSTLVGNVEGITSRIFVTQGNANVTGLDLLLYNYTTLVQNETVNTHLQVGNTTYIPFTFYKVVTPSLSNFTTKIKTTNNFGFITFTSNFTTVSSTYHYDGSLNYTVSRPNPFSSLHLSVLRQPITFKIECNYKTGIFDNGFWHNYTKVGYYDKTDQVQSTDTVYISCYNDQLLFSIVSYGNLNGTSLIHNFSGSFGLLFGVPVIMLFLIFLAAIGTGRSATTIFIMWAIALGILNFLQFFPAPIAPWTWGAVVLFVVLGIFSGKKIT